MSISNSYLGQLDYEATITRKFLKLYPADKGNYKPHEKNMELNRLTGHLVELVDWVDLTLNYPELNWVTFSYQPAIAENAEQISSLFEEKLAKAISVLQNTDDSVYKENWTMRAGDKVFFTMPKIAVLRNYVFNHIIHHRAQLGIYYRMLDITVPSSYGPSKDQGI